MSTPPSWIGLPSRLPNDSEAFKQHLWQAVCNLRTWTPGYCLSVDTASYAQPVVQVQLGVRENVAQNLAPTPTAIPPITMPFAVMRSGGFMLTMPVAAGDECICLFGDNDWHAWWQSGGVQNQIKRRRHSLNDGIAIFGLSSCARPISNYSATSAQVRTESGTTMVEVTAAGVVNIVSAGNVNITATASTKIQGRDFLLHTHSGVQTGGGNSGPVV